MSVLIQVLEARHVFQYDEVMREWCCVGTGNPSTTYCPGCGETVSDEEMCRLELPHSALYVTIALAKRLQA